MEETNDKIQNLNIFLEKRTQLLNELKGKEDVTNLTQNDDKELVATFENLLNDCKEYDSKIKQLKTELEPRFYIKFDDSNYIKTEETALVLKKENKIVNWFKNKINEFKYNYAVERAIKRDSFYEDKITNQINSFSAYFNVIKENGNKAIFKKYMNNVANVKFKNFSENKI